MTETIDMTVADPELSGGGSFQARTLRRRSRRRIQGVGRGVPYPPPLRWGRGRAVVSPQKILKNFPLGVLHFVAFSCAFKQLLNL